MFGPINAWDLTINPLSHNEILAGCLGTDSVGIMRSLDGGATWDTVLTWPDMASIVYNPINPDTVFAGAGFFLGYQEQGHGEGVWRSVDGGATWNKVGLDTISVQSIAVDPNFPSVVYAGTYDFYEFPKITGIYKSADGGTTWNWLALLNKDVWKVSVRPDSTNIIFAATWDSIYRSKDFGITWQALNVPTSDSMGFFMDMEIADSDNNTMYAVSIVDGLFKSTDGGDTWSSVNTTLSAKRAFSVTIHPANPNIVFHTQMGLGILKTIDGGTSWQEVNSGYKCHYPNAFDIDANSNLIAAFYNEEDNLFASVKKWNGANWTETNLDDYWMETITAHPSDSNIIYASARDHNLPKGNMYKTSDGGAAWTVINTGLPNDILVNSIVIDPTSPNTVYVATGFMDITGGRGVYKSTDGGLNWSSSGLTSSLVFDLAMHPDSSTIIYAATLDNVYKTTDGGTTWQPTALSTIPVRAIAIDPTNPQRLFAGSIFFGLYRTDNGGITWNNVALAGKSINDIVIDPLHPNSIYTTWWEFGAITDYGLHSSFDGGTTWNDFSIGLFKNEYTGLAVNPTKGKLYVGSLGYGVYERQIFTLGTGINAILNDSYILYPNPACQYAILEFNNINYENQTLTLYNTQGQLIKTITNIRTNKITVNTDDLTSGLYFFKLSNDKQLRFTGKLIIE